MSVEYTIRSPDDLHAVSGYVCDSLESGVKALRVEIKAVSSRTEPQLRTYWMWMGELSTQIKKRTGERHDTETLHIYFKERFCPNKTVRLGKREVSTKSTKKLDSGEMHFYMNQVQEWAVNAGFSLTVPIKSEYRELMERQVR